MERARLIIDSPASGSWNMAVDEALLRSASDRSSVTLRLYRWEQPTISLGYFQSHQTRVTHVTSQGCPLVRRSTGGGAIIHDQELTYSLTAPIADRLDQQIARWYDVVHDSWLETLASFGVQSRRCEATDPEREGEFLCFRRRTAGDLLLGPWKIGGSAQRRQKRAALQHGSLLISQSPAAPELPGIDQISPARLAETDWIARWLEDLSHRLEVVWTPGELDDQEQERAAELKTVKFGCKTWTQRR